MMRAMHHEDACTPSRCVSGCLVGKYGPPPGGYDDDELQAWAESQGYFERIYPTTVEPVRLGAEGLRPNAYGWGRFLSR